MDGASKATLENEFGTTNDEEAIKQILEKGTLQESEVRISSFLSRPSIPLHNKKPDTDRSSNSWEREQVPRTTAWVPELHTRYVGTRTASGIVEGFD
jgi:hypothetical protein